MYLSVFPTFLADLGGEGKLVFTSNLFAPATGHSCCPFAHQVSDVTSPCSNSQGSSFVNSPCNT